jgi:uncharacterized protein YciI
VSAAPIHHILFYDYVEDMAERRGPHREAHLARNRAEREAGRITLAGALGDPQPDDVSAGQEGEAGRRAARKLTGAAIVFRDVSPEEIEAFAQDDPYVTAGLVTGRRIERWNVV